MSKPKIAILGGIVIFIILVILAYWYSPLTQSGCKKLETKIRQEMGNASYCDLAGDCSVSLDVGCSFECAGYFNNKVQTKRLLGWFKRFSRRCRQCEDECWSALSNPACLGHTCAKSGGEVSIKTDKQEYGQGEPIILEAINNLGKMVSYNFPISLCLRPTIMRLEKYNPETKEWLSQGVGLLFEDGEVVFYKSPDTCSIYKIKDCLAETATDYINKEDLEFIGKRTYSISPSIVESCQENDQEKLISLSGRFRIALYYERTDKQGEQIYSNEFAVEQ